MPPIGTIKLRSPAPQTARRGAAAGCRPGLRVALPAAAIFAPPAWRRGSGFLDRRRRPRRQPASQFRQAPNPCPGHDALAINQENTLIFANKIPLAAPPVPHPRHTATAGLAGASAPRPGHPQAPLNPTRPAPRTGEKLVPPPAGPIISAAQNPARAIAYLTRRFKVGLMANRDDHVTDIPAVLSRRPARSGG